MPPIDGLYLCRRQIVGESPAEAMDLRVGATALDVAAGNGNASLALARRCAAVVPLTTSLRCLSAAVGEPRLRGSAMDFQEADAEAVPFAGAAFDAVASTFGVMFAPDQDRAAAEMPRVCRPVGRIGRADRSGCRRLDAQHSFGIDRFDRIGLSFCLSMIPDWTGALRTAVDRLAPQGQVHVVDFGDQAGFPAWFRTGLSTWLAKFHVQPRDSFRSEGQRIAADCGADAEWRSLCRGYAQYASLSRP